MYIVYSTHKSNDDCEKGSGHRLHVSPVKMIYDVGTLYILSYPILPKEIKIF